MKISFLHRATMAVAHPMLIVIYHVLRDGVAFVNLCSDFYTKFNRGKKIAADLKNYRPLADCQPPWLRR